MTQSNLLNTLNKAQRDAVTAPLGHLMILAGAGSGKTKVLTNRIAWLIKTGQAKSNQILAVTFTNKAANEMRERINVLLKEPTPGLWVGTFHGIAHRLLRIHWEAAQLPQNFQIMDSEDQKRLLKQVIRSLEMDDKVFTPRKAAHFINARKDQALRAKDVVADDNYSNKMLKIYYAYENACQTSGIVDFAELLLRSYELLRDNPILLEQYQSRFEHLHVDEFQDTNTIQYQWLALLLGKFGKLFVVFDDDQSIYGWRGAKIENIQHLQNQFDNISLIRLEQNYRSTGNILNAANALIARNQDRLGKELWTKDHAGEPIFIFKAYNETDEAQYVANRIRAWRGRRQDIAILYRTTAQSRVFEESLLQKGIPYRIYGGLRFYERLEIKDTLAYLRLVQHPHDNGAFERVLNTPKRGIGLKTLGMIRELANQQTMSLWQAAQHLIATKQLKARAASSLFKFLDLIEQLSRKVTDLSLDKKIERVKIASGLIEHYKKDTKQDAQRRLENLEELTNAARQFEENNQNVTDILTAFLDHAALEAGERQSGKSNDNVQLMTLHSAKGLEFKVVFICGLEEGLFPHQNSLDELQLEEERRLCYVGITRARNHLHLSHSETRYRYGTRDVCKPSRFLKEIPKELVKLILK
ncbi:UvrD-helicase domain-containing protein [Candidatus Marithrix sp. Canyon 246]|uniref:UvrD-helicase domain-containing protein n=1 Tax=Candidatus Marithrix sp. Canyon 246 TaxID=1827136 RepID=UPI00084A1988|nr:UvrD-helicase domain-containing protein [Candidatus Marithrix sp. Canyon 246]